MYESQLIMEIEEFNDYFIKSASTKCRVAQSEFGKGLFVDLQSAQDDPVVLSVDDELIITARRVRQYAKDKEHSFLDKLLQVDDQGSPIDPQKLPERKVIFRFLLYQMLLVRRGTPDVKFSQWLVSLPKLKDMNLPFTWTQDDVIRLEPTSIYGATRAKMVVMDRNYNGFFSHSSISQDIRNFVAEGPSDKKVKVDHIITYNDWLLMESWISSRCLEIPKSKNDTQQQCGPGVDSNSDIPDLELEDDVPELEMALVPFVDFANHSKNSTAVFEKVGDKVALILKDAIAPPDFSAEKVEVTINYGPDKGSSEFLFNYGFIPADHGNSKSLSVHYQPEDDAYRPILDVYYNPDCDPNSDDYDSSYEALVWFINRPTQRLVVKSMGDSYWSDDFIFLLSLRSELEIATDDDAETDYALYFKGKKLDLEQLETYLKNNYQDIFYSQLLPSANLITKRFIEKYLNDMPSLSENFVDTPHLGDKLANLEKQLLLSVQQQL